MSTRRRMPGAFSQAPPRSPEGLPLCRWCRRLVPAGRSTFCSAACVHEWRLRTDPGYLRRCLFARDKGKCASCGVDTMKLYAEYRTDLKTMGFPKACVRAKWKQRGFTIGTSFWNADHILEVVEGGGECDLGGYQTLCVPCHKKKSAAYLKQRALARKLAKQQPSV